MERGEYVYSPFRVPSSLSLFDEQQPSVLDSPHFIGNGRHLAGVGHDDDALAFIAGEGGKIRNISASVSLSRFPVGSYGRLCNDNDQGQPLTGWPFPITTFYEL